ncbi:AAA domain-containing protein [Mangrovihabitans endophyticus]|uniref:Very short patch repair endonuclease n=1 Tax=Mangrovihabitans endophyticus TaxID=1751298 RepID=A0A8J3BZM7_9ACTN|nr:AAA domain-containing protein [Mangrovihabitans endophyticus]GGK87045.1 very short patch repair endonuclease [Mangrovihabitans endophyticus]
MSESPIVIRDRAVAVADYLLAVRAQMDRPARTVPDDADWLDGLPEHPDCRSGPAADGTSWLRVGLPPAPAPVPVPAELRRRLTEVSADDEPKLDDADELFATWRDEQWRPWARETAEAERTRALHRRLFDLMHRLDMSSATTELVWGHGVLEAEVGGQRVRYPLVATPVMIDYAPDHALVSVSPTGPPRLQTDALAGLDERYLRQLLALAGPAGVLDVDLWNDLDRRELFERALGRLGYDRVVVGPGEEDERHPGTGGSRGAVRGAHVVDTGVLFVRPRQRLLRGFIEAWRDRLLGDEPGPTGPGPTGASRRGPAAVGALASVVAHEPSALRMPGDDPEAWRRVGERLLMPLPTNQAQESIARRLAQHRNVAVQGPPGTGKTHTIRNLICHLMASGKRVLVVAQKEDPLRVLRDGLPEEVQALCLAVLGRTTDQLVQLQLAARELADRAATLDRDAETARVAHLTRLLEDAESELTQALSSLRAIAESEAATYAVDGVRLSPAEVGAWLREHAAAYGGIPDAVGEPPPLTADEFGVLLDIGSRLSPADRRAAVAPLADVTGLPAAAQAHAARERRAEASAAIDDLSAAGVDVTEVRALGPDGAQRLRGELREAVSWLRRREGGWTDRLGRLLADPHWQQVWTDHLTATAALLDELAGLTRALAGHRVDVPAQLAGEPKRTLLQLAEMRQRFAAGKGLSRLMQPGLAKLADEIRVDDEALRTTSDVDLATAWLQRRQARRRLAERWAEWSQRLDIPARTGDPESWAGTLVSEARQSLDWDTREWPHLSTRLRAVLPQAELGVDAARLAAVCETLDGLPVVFEHDDLGDADQAVARRLEPWPALAASWVTLADWDAAVAEVRRRHELRPTVQRYVELRDRLAVPAPEWAAQIDAGAVPAVSGEVCRRAWTWRAAQSWFDEVIGGVDPAVLGRRVESSRDRMRRLTAELVVASSWLEVAAGLDDRRRAALADWTTALRKIGKGTGRNAAAWQQHAQRAMAAAVEAVPVWVMSVDRAVEQFAGGAHFDVVIVDEASQADLFALPVLALADRAVVVGDDQQIGPQLGFVGSVTGLISGHLSDVPSAEHFDPESSLYDHAVRRSPERILLTEHFRCVPQIIEFSSRHYYDGKIMPLRADRPALDPVRTVFLPSGAREPLPPYGEVNHAEASALVAQVCRMVRDPAYAGRTIGVISLLSTSGQAAYLLSLLRDEIGEDEMEARRLRVGDAYTFQGDERDVMLLSLVVSAGGGRIAAFTRREYHRRINVAASRARDQLWIFHSVQPSDLLADDARGLLLTYAQNQAAADPSPADPVAVVENDFEREVLRRLVERGLTPTPQFRIGAYRIDFVLAAPDGRRLAIECDGAGYLGVQQWESDMRRQAVLERVGNCVFVRIRASVFARAPEVAMRPVWQRLDELGIGPQPSPAAVES